MGIEISLAHRAPTFEGKHITKNAPVHAQPDFDEKTFYGQLTAGVDKIEISGNLKYTPQGADNRVEVIATVNVDYIKVKARSQSEAYSKFNQENASKGEFAVDVKGASGGVGGSGSTGSGSGTTKTSGDEYEYTVLFVKNQNFTLKGNGIVPIT
jgi:hypothetical protein